MKAKLWSPKVNAGLAELLEYLREVWNSAQKKIRQKNRRKSTGKTLDPVQTAKRIHQSRACTTPSSIVKSQQIHSSRGDEEILKAISRPLPKHKLIAYRTLSQKRGPQKSCSHVWIQECHFFSPNTSI